MWNRRISRSIPGLIRLERLVRVKTNFTFQLPRIRLQHIAELFKPGAKGIIAQVCVALSRLNLRVAEELSDHWQRHAA